MARKISDNAAIALATCGSFNSGNTRVWEGALTLHGNRIADRNESGELHITNAGWFSNTTKERLNALPGVHIQQKKGVWYLNGTQWDGSWVKVYEY